MCYNTALEVFLVQPPPPPEKEKKYDENGELIVDEEEDPGEPKEVEKPKFQQHIYPNSVILLRGSDDYLR